MAARIQKGAPTWMVTFADLMALLLTLFVLLLTFAELDAKKYEAMAGSMRQAFGAWSMNVMGRQGTSGNRIVASIELDAPPAPATASPIPAQEAATQEATTQQAATQQAATQPGTPTATVTIDEETAEELARRRLTGQAEALEKQVGEVIERQMTGSGIHVVREGFEVLIRFPSDIAFGSGKADVSPELGRLLDAFAEVLTDLPGRILISGHTDDVPLGNGGPYRSNLDLSSSRAAAVAHRLMETEGISASRFVIQGYGESRPVTANDTAENRARNRRVELKVIAE